MCSGDCVLLINRLVISVDDLAGDSITQLVMVKGDDSYKLVII